MRHNLLYVLSAIVILNVIAIVILSSQDPPITETTVKAAKEIREEKDVEQAPYSPEPIEEVPQSDEELVGELPKVRTLILQDETACPDCYDIRLYLRELRDVINMDIDTGDHTLFRSYRLPALAFDQNLEEYPYLIENWDTVGFTTRILAGEHEGLWYVLPTINPPYYDVTSDYVVGRVRVTYLTMDSCPECYDVMINRIYLEESRITPYEEITVDVLSEEGQALVQQYGIRNVPTVLLSRDAQYYQNFLPGWEIVGTREEDGTFVLRELQKLQVQYYDLQAKRVMKP